MCRVQKQKAIKEKGSQENLKALIHEVGVVRLELTTTCTPCKYASQLRHTPFRRCKNTIF